MINVKNGQIDLVSLEVEDIIDIRVLQNFLDNFALGMNCAAVSVNRQGEEITRPSHYRAFCNDYIHSNRIGDQRCAECHSQMGDQAVKQGKPYVGKCHAGLVDFAAPIIVNGEHLGTILGGQILDVTPNESNIRQVAREIGLDEDGLWEAAERIDIVNKTNIDAAAEVLHIIANTFAQDGYKRIETEFLSTELANNFVEISKTIESLAISAVNVTYSQHELSEEIHSIDKVTKEIESVLKDITKVANNTKLIGFNAAIEAARLGNDGRGFAVVANEIQALADNSKETAAHIAELNKQINGKLDSTVQNSEKTLSITEEQSAAMEELSATVQAVTELAGRLKTLFDIK